MDFLASTIVTLAAVGSLILTSVLLGSKRTRRRATQAVVIDACDHTSRQDCGAVRSVQTAELYLPVETLERIWTPMHLERLGRTYWRFLTRVTLGIVRVRYTDHERYLVAFMRPFRLLSFQAPEYEMDAGHGVVRWRIERGLLVARRGATKGHLQIDVRRMPSAQGERAHLRLEIEVANFYPAIAFSLGRRLYDLTQSRLHVAVTKAFLRSLARLDLAESRVGRFAEVQGTADSPPAQTGQTQRHPERLPAPRL